MRRSAWIFFASIFLPSLGLAWLAIRSVQDQQVVLEHQQVIISQNITDVLAKQVQEQMDAVRADFVKTTQGLLDVNASPESLARDFNRTIRATWPMAEIGFAVNLNGQIYSPKLYDDQGARTFRNENDRFLTNRENVEVYSNSFYNIANNAQNGAGVNGMKLQGAIFGNGLNNSVTQSMAGSGQLRSGLNANGTLAVDSLTAQKQIDEPVLTLNKKEAETYRTKSFTLPSGNVEAAKKSAPTLASGNVPPITTTAGTLSSLGNTAAAAGNLETDAHAKTPDMADKNAKDFAKESQLDADASAPKAMLDKAAQPSISAATSGGGASASTGAVTLSPVAAPAASTAPVSEAVPGSLSGGAAALAVPAVPALPAPSVQASTAGTERADDAQTRDSTADKARAVQQSSQLENADLVDRVETKLQKVQRQVIPQRMLARDSAPVSNTLPADSDFRRIIGTDSSGELARFLENKLRLIVWSHAATDSPIIFGAQLDQARLVAALQAALQIPDVDIRTSYDRVSTNYCTAIIDDTGHPVALSRPGFVADWKHPFVATEIGEALPHWEAALYQVDPQQIGRAARTVQWTIGLIVLLLVAAIVAGGSLIAADVRRQVRLAQQKTDFVSNVSHELKTPLTSIRMFADLLAEKRVPDEERQATYLRIIAAEASRLTRLINNVLDFARLERGAKDAAPGEHRACDLVETMRDVIDTCGPHLEAAGIVFRHEIEADALPIQGDRDALAQIILNLVSNAEKYGGSDVLVRARRQETASGTLGCVDVLDRGAGIPAREVKTIFEPFQRLDDSLSSGIPGSGLGLTLARRMARAHGGDVTYSARAGGGSCFTLTIPLEKIPA